MAGLTSVRRPRVLLIGPVPPPVTGMSVAVETLVDHLKPTHDVRLINLSKTAADDFLGRFIRIPQVLDVLWQAWLQVRWADSIYITNSQTLIGNLKDLCLYLLASSKLKNVTVHLHGGESMRRLMQVPVVGKINAFFLRRLHKLIVLGPSLRDVFGSAVPPEKVVVVPNCARDSLFVAEAEIARKFANTRPLRVLFLSNLYPGKGYIDLLEAFSSLPQNLREAVQLDFAGDFIDSGQNRAFLQRLHACPQAKYHGPVVGAAKARLFEQSHVFCLPTYYAHEGQPISILEAYASGCVVVTTHHSGIRDIFVPDRNGFTVEKASARSLAEALTRAIESREMLASIALNNRREAEQFREDQHTWRVISIIDGGADWEQRPVFAPPAAADRKILFVAPLPPPLTGHSLASLVLRNHLADTHELATVNLSVHSSNIGTLTIRRTLEVVKAIIEVWRHRHAHIIYFTISQSIFGNLKDLLIYLACGAQLPRMFIHLHGGAIRKLLFDKHPVIRWLNSLAIKRLAGVVVTGPAHVDIFKGMIPAERIHQVANFAEDYLFLPRDDVARKFTDVRPLNVLYLSGMGEAKGCFDLVEAYLNLSEPVRSQIRLDFAGAFYSREDEADFKNFTRGFSEIRYHGIALDDLKRRLFAEAHVFCLPTRMLEGQPISILEAYASGCVVVTTGQEGIHDIFQDGRNGFEIAVSSPTSIGAVLERLVQTGSALAPIALRNHDVAESEYRAARFTASMGRILEHTGGNAR